MHKIPRTSRRYRHEILQYATPGGAGDGVGCTGCVNEAASRDMDCYPKCAALFELPLMVYAQIMEDNTTRKRPYRVSEARVRKVIGSMPEFQ